MEPKRIIELFDRYLVDRSCVFEAVCIGGTALALLGVITRETQDCDVLSPVIPEPIKLFSEEFAREISASGLTVKSDWLNNGPHSLLRDLESGWESLKNCLRFFHGWNCAMRIRSGQPMFMKR